MPPGREISRRRRRFRGDAHATTWLLVIARNLFANYVRGRKTAKRDAPEVSLEGLKDERDAPSQLPADDPDALEGVLDEERREYLREAVRALPGRTRQIMRLVFVHGLKYREIAELLGISVNTVKSSVFQGKKKLKNILSDRAPDLDLDLGVRKMKAERGDLARALAQGRAYVLSLCAELLAPGRYRVELADPGGVEVASYLLDWR